MTRGVARESRNSRTVDECLGACELFDRRKEDFRAYRLG